jgi:hypothetical protein
MTRFTIARVQGIAGVLLAAAIGGGCTKEQAPPPDAAGDVSAADSGVDISASDALIDSKPDTPLDTLPTPPANVLFPDPPQPSCSTASNCELPPSACADPGCVVSGCPGEQWVVYYDHPECTAGKCVFEQRYFRCSGSYACSGGGCRYNGTAP